MSWSISASGTKAECLTQVAAATSGCPGAEKAAFDAAKTFATAQLNAQPGANARVTASGNTDGCTVSITGT